MGVMESFVTSAMKVRILILGKNRFKSALTLFSFVGLRPWRMMLKPR